MKRLLRRHDSAVKSDYLALRNSGNIFIMPKFKHLMMDCKLVEVEIPLEYYEINKEAIEFMASNTQTFIKNLRKS
jgi:hypothetical protein